MFYVHLDGKLLPQEEASIPITDRGFLFGDGTFTTIRVFQGRAEFLSSHLKRLEQHCQQLQIVPPTIKIEWIEDLIKKSHATEGIWRLKILITGGHKRGLNLSLRTHGHLLMTLHPYSIQPLTPSRLCVFPQPIQSPLASLKTLSYLERLVINDYAIQKGYDDALTLSPEGYLMETAFSNLFWSDGERFFAPDPSLPYLQGIIFSQLRKYKPFEFLRARLQDLPNDVYVYTCNSLAHIRPVIEIQDKTFVRNHVLEKEIKDLLNS